MVLFCINLDGSFVESSGFVTWSLPTKVCGTIGYEVTFFIFKSIYNLTKKKKKKAFISYVNLRFFGLFVLVLPLKKWDGNTMLPIV